MADKRNLINPQNTGLIQDLIQRTKLIWKLMSDRRVSFVLKLLPVAAAIYLVSPIDLLPGLALPVIGALDDAAIIWFGTTLFVSLCPPEVVREHTEELEGTVAADWRDAPEDSSAGEIVPVQPPHEPEG